MIINMPEMNSIRIYNHAVNVINETTGVINDEIKC